MTTHDKKTILTERDLQHFQGNGYYWSTGKTFHPFVYTDGVLYAMMHGNADWLLTLIGSWQFETVVKDDKALQKIQFWTLIVNDNHSVEMICERDQGDVVVRQEIAWPNVLLSGVRFYLQHMEAYWAAARHPNRDPRKNGVLHLPSEY
ncbi:hypothetical protein NDI52_07345 [Leptolyngbya sp. PL-A3]|uniref:DUF6876 family protein n=1 Tax=Leptolyngbya sp. PL-A3 TaxID=2933911 RepID=UPI0032993168